LRPEAWPIIHPWLPALGDALGKRSTIEAPIHDSETGLKNCTFEEVDRAIDVLLPTGAFDVEADWTQDIWRIARSLGVEGWPLVEKISYVDDQDLRLVKWNFYVDDGTVVICTPAGKPTEEEKRLAPGDDPRSVAKRLARDAWRREQKTTERVPGFGKPIRYRDLGY
jgi:hypothetical protein